MNHFRYVSAATALAVCLLAAHHLSFAASSDVLLDPEDAAQEPEPLPVGKATGPSQSVSAAVPSRPSQPQGRGARLLSPADIDANAPWVSMPAGARITYIGIHGGTVPVSLLTSGDGSPMIARVGLTGSDFLHFMRSGGKPTAAPAAVEPLAEGEMAPGGVKPAMPGKNATMLMAGTAVGDVPVIYATGRSFEDMSLPANWAPFGLTEKALAAEGAVKVVMPPKKKHSRRPRG